MLDKDSIRLMSMLLFTVLLFSWQCGQAAEDIRLKQLAKFKPYQVVDDNEQTAFEQLVQEQVPLTKEQIIEFRDAIEGAKAAALAVPNSPPKPTITTQVVNLATGSTPPIIRLAKGFVTTIVLLDSTGSPWPIKGYDLGNPKAFSIQWDKKSNIMMIQANDTHQYGNLVLQLHNLNAPVSLSLVTSQRDVDYRVDFRVPGYGPNAQMLPLVDGYLISETSELLKVLDGIPPQGAEELESEDDGVTAWQQNNKLYVRTQYTLVSPAWLSSITSADQNHAYELSLTPILSVSYQGRVKQIKLKGIDYGRK